MEKLYTLKEAREILRVCNKTIQRWDKDGKIKCIRTPGNRRLIPESEILRITSKIIPIITEKKEIKPKKAEIEPKMAEVIPDKPEIKTEISETKPEKEAAPTKEEETRKPKKESPKKPIAPKEITRYAVLDALEPSGLALRSAFGDLLSAAALLKKFTNKDLMARARCPETVASLFCQRMKSLNYLADKDGVFEMQIEVLR
jgi:excisionase family DNA binding protein